MGQGGVSSVDIVENSMVRPPKNVNSGASTPEKGSPQSQDQHPAGGLIQDSQIRDDTRAKNAQKLLDTTQDEVDQLEQKLKQLQHDMSDLTWQFVDRFVMSNLLVHRLDTLDQLRRQGTQFFRV